MTEGNRGCGTLRADPGFSTPHMIDSLPPFSPRNKLRSVLQPTVYDIQRCIWLVELAGMDPCPPDIPLPPGLVKTKKAKAVNSTGGCP